VNKLAGEQINSPFTSRGREMGKPGSSPELIAFIGFRFAEVTSVLQHTVSAAQTIQQVVTETVIF
jgi:hypothetical protein